MESFTSGVISANQKRDNGDTYLHVLLRNFSSKLDIKSQLAKAALKNG
jgi:hypothetical protein